MISKTRTNTQVLYKDSEIIKSGKYIYEKKWFGITVYRGVHIEKNGFCDEVYEDGEKKVGYVKKK